MIREGAMPPLFFIEHVKNQCPAEFLRFLHNGMNMFPGLFVLCGHLILSSKEEKEISYSAIF